MKKLFILRGNTQSEKTSRSLSGLSVSLSACQTHFLQRWLPEPLFCSTIWLPHTQRHTHTQTFADLCLHPQWTIFILDSETDTHTHKHTPLSILQLCSWKKNIDAHSTQTATHTHLQYVRTHERAYTKTCTVTHTLLHSAPERGKQKSLTSSCIMCLKCSREAAKQAVTVTALKWGGITQVSFDSEVKAICDTILCRLYPIEDHFDVIMRKNKSNILCEGWIEFLRSLPVASICGFFKNHK